MTQVKGNVDLNNVADIGMKRSLFERYKVSQWNRTGYLI